MLKIREYRKTKNLTIKALAEEAGLSISYISQVERGEVDPSLSSLRKIAAVFQVPIYILLDDTTKSEKLIVRKEQQISKHSENDNITYTFLSPLPTPEFLPKAILMEFELKPFSQDTEVPISHHSEEVVTLLEGEVIVELGSSQLVLSAGDTAVIREDLPHIYKNVKEKPARGIAAFSPPVLGNINPALVMKGDADV